MGEVIKTLFLFLVFVGLIGAGILYLSKNPQLLPKVPGLESQSNLPRINIITDSYFEGGEIPAKYTCRGVNINPYLKFEKVPVGAKALNIIYVNPDAPGAPFYHWVVINIDPKLIEIKENSIPKGGEIMINDFGYTTYSGPCPENNKNNKYQLYVFATSEKIDKAKFESTEQLLQYLKKNAQAMGLLTGKFK